ncbi:MAG: SpoIIE family protein phosphatase [Ignavibacteriales bacterium]|nr:SpoIIE family protein phosphatase [Ignavibacteriales bacterium]
MNYSSNFDWNEKDFKFQEGEFSLESGDFVVMVTDGVPETFSKSKELFFDGEAKNDYRTECHRRERQD